MSGPIESRIPLEDGLSMHVKTVRGGRLTPAICIPGLTRNAADFDDFAPLCAATGRDVYAISLRGRGRSDYDPNYLNYFPTTYVKDVVRALDRLGIDRAVYVGTSLGGITTMLTAISAPARIQAAIINDVGPELAPEGIARIAGYVGARAAGEGARASSLDEAAAQIRAINEVAFPGRDDEFWNMMARRTFDRDADGMWRLAYDPNIGRALLEAGPAPDLWAAFAALAEIPTLVVRGAISDLLTRPIIEKMRKVHPDFDFCEVPDTGHAPTLTEPSAQQAINAFLAKID